MRFTILLFFVFFANPSCIAQQQGAIWMMGKQADLDFTSGMPKLFS